MSRLGLTSSAFAAACLLAGASSSAVSSSESDLAAHFPSRELTGLAKLNAFLRSTPSSSISRLGALLDLDTSKTPFSLKKENRDGEFSLTLFANSKSNFVTSARFDYQIGPGNFLVEYAEIRLSNSVCVKIDDFEHSLKATRQYMSGSHSNLRLDSWEIVEGSRSIFLDQIETNPSSLCVTQFNVDAEPPILFVDKPN